jgi:hypothetical protein
MYQPDGWKFVKIIWPTGLEDIRLAGGWSGGYTTGDSWKLNSGVNRIEKGDGYYDVVGDSGSVYRINEHGEDRSLALTMAFSYLDQQLENGTIVSWERLDSSEILNKEFD